MLRGKITKNDGEWVYILTENKEPMVAKRDDIDFGILVGDSVFLSSSGDDIRYFQVNKEDILSDDEAYYLDSRHGERAQEYHAYMQSNIQKNRLAQESGVAKSDDTCSVSNALEEDAKEEPQGFLKFRGLIVLGGVMLVAYLLLFIKGESPEEVERKAIERHKVNLKYECKSLIRENLKAPNSYKEMSISQRGGYDGVIVIHYTAQNSFGVELAQQAVCTYDRDGITNFQI